MSDVKFAVSNFLDDYVAQPTIREQITQRCADLLRDGVSIQIVNGLTGEVTKIVPFGQYFIFGNYIHHSLDNARGVIYIQSVNRE